MSCEEFANYVAKTVAEYLNQPEVKNVVRKAFAEESISPSVFIDADEEELETAISPHFKNANPPVKYGLGFRKSFKRIKDHMYKCAPVNCPGKADNVWFDFRPFDMPVPTDFAYKVGYCNSTAGNMFVPVRAFRHSETISRAYIAREVIRFAAACINERQNGTIHFGIKKLDGEINGADVGIASSKDLQSDCINEEIMHYFKESFRGQAGDAQRCIRPVQVVPVESKELFVFEIDVIPSTCFCPSELLAVVFPPKGPQSKKIFLLNQAQKCEILTAETCQLDNLQKTYKGVFKQRITLENETNEKKEGNADRMNELKELLVGKGNNYVTDEYIPIIVSGNISGCPNEKQIRGEISMEFAYKSAKVVLDFDASTQLRKKIENKKLTFDVKTAEDVTVESKVSIQQNPIWMYCNGNNDLSMNRQEMKDWVKNRFTGVIKLLQTMRDAIPYDRARLIFLIYNIPERKKDPFIETARQALISTFPNECVFIASDQNAFSALKAEMDQFVDSRMLHRRSFSGLDWASISKLMSTVFRPNPNIVCKLPSSSGQVVLMTQKEREKFRFIDIEILSGEQCKSEAEKMTNNDRRIHEEDMERTFYKGGQPADWWNFYYKDHVGKRSAFLYHEDEIKKKLISAKGEALFEEHTIDHHPGAGGSTLARHLLWHFSQFSEEKEPYRCCLVKNITDHTVEEIERFRSFKDETAKRPFIVLVDNKNEDGVMMLKVKLNEAAYKTGSPGRLFCLLLLVNRVPISEKPSERNSGLLTHQLKGKEIYWFEKKYKELEQRQSVKVDTLIAFNVMRKSFDPEYIKQLTTNFLSHVTAVEMKVLRCLSLINSFDSDHAVPQSVFDRLMKEQANLEIFQMPYGIAHSMKERQKLAEINSGGVSCFWNVNMSNAMSLLVTRREGFTLNTSGICIISQPLAKAVLQTIKEQDGITLEDMVVDVLNLVEECLGETNPMSKKFVKIVCSLFKTRQIEEPDRKETKLKFSDLVLELKRDLGAQVVLNLMGKCFAITDDAMVGQQLARFNIHVKDFDEAELAIQKSLQHKSENAYLLDTYGQIFKSRMEYVLDQVKKGDKMQVECAANVSDMAFKAIDKFIEGQKIAIKEDDDIGCFHMEVKTALTFLEKFEKFECYDNESFLDFLKNPDYEINKSPYLHLMEICPRLEQIKRGTKWQVHLENSLRYLEESNYQIKRQLYTVNTENDVLLLQIRERFERFYGESNDRFHFRFGLGLKQIMTASESKQHKDALKERVNEADSNLDSRPLKTADVRDLLVYIGFYISQLSSKSQTVDQEMYSNLLRYSTKLLDIQRQEQGKLRLYLESYLFFAMLHWPLKSRCALGLNALSHGATYDTVVIEWAKTFNDNHFINSQRRGKLKKPKNYFALGKGGPGNDIIDLESVKKEWRSIKGKKGRLRRPVMNDHFWREDFVEERLERLTGVMDGSGHSISTEVI